MLTLSRPKPNIARSDRRNPLVLEPEQLANELHDGVIQEMTALVLQLEIYQRRLKVDPESAHDDIERIKSQAKSSLEQLRGLVTKLRSEGGA